MHRMRVLQIGKYYHPYIGGTENHLLTLVKELKKEVKVIVLVANTRFKTSVERDDGVDIYRIARLGSLFSLPLTLSMPLWLKRQKADILHFHLPNPLSVLSYFLSRPKGKIVVTYHSDIIRQRFFNPLFNPFLMKFLKRTEAIIVTSDNLIKNSPILRRFRDKCKIIPYGIDTSRFQADGKVIKKAEEIRQKYGSPLILFAGRLVYYKGLEYLLKAMKDVKARLLIVGSGPLENRLKKLARHYEVCDKVIWIGEIENEKIAPYYYASNVFVLPSSIKAESFGIVQLEAFACGKPVVSTNLPTGVTFVNQDEKTGLVVPPKDSEVLSQAVNKLLESQELRNRYGRKAKERAENEFTKDRMTEETLKIYNIII